jgi:CRP-like cAMP-binding protein
MVVHGDASIASLVVDRGVCRQLRAGEVLFRQGDRSDSVYECLSGRLRLVVSATGGRELLLDVVLPGEVFGQLAAFDGEPRSASAVTMESSVVAELPACSFLEAVRSQPALAMAALRSLSVQLRRADERICSGETEHVASRTAKLLMDLGERLAPGHEVLADVVIPFSQQQLAEWIGASREAAARALAQLRRDGVISTRRSAITIHDHRRLAEAAASSGP